MGMDGNYTINIPIGVWVVKSGKGSFPGLGSKKASPRLALVQFMLAKRSTAFVKLAMV